MKKFISVLLCLSLIFAFSVSGFCAQHSDFFEISDGIYAFVYDSSADIHITDGIYSGYQQYIGTTSLYTYFYLDLSAFDVDDVITIYSSGKTLYGSSHPDESLSTSLSSTGLTVLSSCYSNDGGVSFNQRSTANSRMMFDSQRPSYITFKISQLIDSSANSVSDLRHDGFMLISSGTGAYYFNPATLSAWKGTFNDKPLDSGYTSSLQAGQSFYVNPGYACIIKLGSKYDSSDNIHLDAITGQSSRGLAYTSGHNLSFSDTYQPNKIFDVVNNTLLWDSNGSIFKASNHGSKYISASQFSGQYMYLSNPKSAGQMYNTLSSAADNGQMLIIPSFPVEWVKMVMLQENPVFGSIDNTSETLQYVSISSGGAIVDEGYVYSQNNDLDSVGKGVDFSHLSILPQTSIPDNGISFGDSEKNLISKLEQLISGREQNVSDVVDQGQGFFGVLSSLFDWLPSDMVILISSFFAILLIVAVIKLFL